MNVSSNIIIECKKLGVDADVPPVKLKQGSGDAVTTILTRLLDKTLKSRRMRFNRPNFKGESHEDDGENIELEEDDANILVESNEEEDEGMEECIESPTKGKDEDEDMNAVIESNIDPHDWKIECERIAPQLKLRDG